ncbi:MAG: DUF4251 domain-containing protein [Prevotella sp.]|nr:DUF4251 domain-containing protein [Prevotella sp.]
MKRHRNRVIWALALGLALALSGCITSQERAARALEMEKKVAQSLRERDYSIEVTMMYPQSMPARNVTPDFGIAVRGDSLYSYLPYFGRAYDIPYGGGKGLDFAAPITDYSDTQPKADRHVIEISVDNDEDLLLYHLDIFVNGRTDITVTSRKRDRISFSGEMTW